MSKRQDYSSMDQYDRLLRQLMARGNRICHARTVSDDMQGDLQPDKIVVFRSTKWRTSFD